ncbi:DUF3138 family protein [Calidifontimicrobium sp. SYSU G02091]|uniref:DUF3138 family protein n=1 Tax=Calidifontimicrobium sp. SYSU G02091 TaxID=2926421 RepID=UPI001F53A64A|nr:DUF3138 family protein [Calidifontimicrobium sp. SYSU G02091]MCI1192056.1 DUF3138 family protein [Calidifontimicrobium sp. SYSU G02091]
MNRIRPTLLALALAAAFPAWAQTNAELLKELQALRERVNELEKKLQQAQPPGGQWGMTPQQAAEFNRIAVKTEALQDNFEDQGYKGLKITGWAEAAYIWNRNQKRAGFQFLNQQEDGYYYDTSYIGAVNLTLTKETDSGTIWKLSLMPNRSPGAVVDTKSIVDEASVSVPLTDLQTRLIAGQIPDWSGYEYMPPTLNPFITHNLLFDFTLPTTYTGVGLDLTRGKWWIRAMLANVNENIVQAKSREPVLVYRADYERGEFSGWGFAGLHGKTANYNCVDQACSKTMTHLFEVDGWYTRGDLTLGGQIGFGMQKKGAIIPDADGNFRDSRWWGVSGMAGWNFTPRLQGLVRVDYLNNAKNGGGLFGYNGYWTAIADGEASTTDYGDWRNGIGPDANLGCYPDPTVDGCSRGANRYALSLGLKYLFNEHTTLKAEYRLDRADRPVFYDVGSDSYKKLNHLLGASVVVAF